MNVLIQDFWDRSPCTWVCDITKLDLNNQSEEHLEKYFR